MYSFHLRSRTVLYLLAAAFLVYLWSYFSSLSDISLLSQRRSPHVNFKHLLIGQWRQTEEKEEQRELLFLFFLL